MSYWVPWTGDKRPVDADTIVTVMLASGQVSNQTPAGNWVWSIGENSPARIIAYRVVPPRMREPDQDIGGEPLPKRPPTFFMVHGTGRGASTYRHASLESAEKEAKRLAAMNPGSEFVVLIALSAAKCVVSDPALSTFGPTSKQTDVVDPDFREVGEPEF